MEKDDIGAAIAEVTGVTGETRRVQFAADIGNAGEDTIDWVFLKNGRRHKATLPRAAFTYQREFDADGGLVNFWLVEMDETAAELFGIEEFVLSDEEAERHKKRILATNLHE